MRAARKGGMPIAIIHENDPERAGCEFRTFFLTTPSDLIDGGLFRSEVAIAFMSGEHRMVSYAQLAKKLGAVLVRKQSMLGESARRLGSAVFKPLDIPLDLRPSMAGVNIPLSPRRGPSRLSTASNRFPTSDRQDKSSLPQP